MTEKKPKICCCGDHKDRHMKNPKSKWQRASVCNDCPCTVYLRRDRPHIGDKMVAILFPILACLIVIPSAILFGSISSDSDFMAKELTFTVEQIIGVLFYVVLFGYLLIWLLISCVESALDVFRYKKRKRFEIK